eukprot:scaffold108937_cov69-Phaeocystis_antarctica.AAC.4
MHGDVRGACKMHLRREVETEERVGECVAAVATITAAAVSTAAAAALAGGDDLFEAVAREGGRVDGEERVNVLAGEEQAEGGAHHYQQRRVRVERAYHVTPATPVLEVVQEPVARLGRLPSDGLTRAARPEPQGREGMQCLELALLLLERDDGRHGALRIGAIVHLVQQPCTRGLESVLLPSQLPGAPPRHLPARLLQEPAVAQAERHPVLVHAPPLLGEEAPRPLDGAPEQLGLELELPRRRSLERRRPEGAPLPLTAAGEDAGLLLLEAQQPRLGVLLQGVPHNLAHFVLCNGLRQPAQLDRVVGHRDARVVDAARHGLDVAAQLIWQQ